MSEDLGPKFSGIVEYLLEGSPQEPIRVAIAPYASLYVLDRASKSFASWLDILKRSRDGRVKITFTYDDNGLRFTSLQLVN